MNNEIFRIELISILFYFYIWMDQTYDVHKVVGKKYQIYVKVLGQG